MKLSPQGAQVWITQGCPCSANYTIPASTLQTFARWRHLNGRHLIPARYSFIDPGRMKG